MKILHNLLQILSDEVVSSTTQLLSKEKASEQDDRADLLQLCGLVLFLCPCSCGESKMLPWASKSRIKYRGLFVTQ